MFPKQIRKDPTHALLLPRNCPRRTHQPKEIDNVYSHQDRTQDRCHRRDRGRDNDYVLVDKPLAPQNPIKEPIEQQLNSWAFLSIKAA